MLPTLYPPARLQARAVRGLEAFAGQSDVGDDVGLVIALVVDVDVVAVGFVGARDAVDQPGQGVVGDDEQPPAGSRFEPDGRNEARLRAQPVADLAVAQGRQLEAAGRLLQFGLVDVQVAAQAGQDNLLPLVAVDDVLDVSGQRHRGVQAPAVGHRRPALGLDRFQVRRRAAAAGRPLVEDGDVLVGQIAVGGFEVEALADLGVGDELVTVFAADVAAVGGDDLDGQAEAAEDGQVSVAHAGVDLVELLGRREAVGVLHDELAQAQQPAAGPQLVAELHAELVEVERQVAVAEIELADQVDEHLLGRAAEGEARAAAVLELHQLEADAGVAVGFPPKLQGVEDRRRRLLGAGLVHFPADDLHQLELEPPAQRQVIIAAGDRFPDIAGLDQQPVRPGFQAGAGALVRAAEHLTVKHCAETRLPFRMMSAY